MPDLLLHLIVPLVALLLFYDRRCRTYILLLSPLAILPDIDHLGSGDFARMWLHNIFVLLPPLFVGAYAYKTGQKKAYSIALIAVPYLGSHMLLDMFQGGISLFYPVIGYNYAVACELLMRNQDITPNIAFTASMPSRNTGLKQDVISSVTVAIAVVFVFIAALRELLARRS